MGKPAARVGDMHTCPMVSGTTPHVGGPVLPAGCPTVLIGGMPAARLGDLAACSTGPDTIAMGSTGVMIGGKPAARMGDSTAHGGVIVAGFPQVLIGEQGSAAAMRAVSAVISGVLRKSFPATAAVAGAVAGATPPPPAELAGPAAGAAAQQPPAQTEHRSWFQTRVEFEDGTPAPGVAYRLKLADGSERVGNTDSDGRVFDGGLPPGECTFSLPEYDQEMWGSK